MAGKYMAVFILFLTVFFTFGYAEESMELKLDKEIYKGLSDRMKITLTAPSLNRNMREPETALVNIAAGGSSSGISFFLTETGKDTGVFTGYLRFNFTESSAAEQTIRVRNAVRLYVSCAGLNAEAAWVPYDAVLQFSSDKYRGLGDSPEVILTDYDLNTDINKAEEVQILIKTISNPQGVYTTLRESSVNSGVFKGSIKLGENLPVIYNDVITASYRDTANSSGSDRLCTAVAVWKPHTAEVKLSKNSFLGLNSRCRITVTDNDMNKSSENIDTVIVRVSSGADPAGISIKLYETKKDSGIFSGDLLFSRYSSSSSGSTIKVAAKTCIKAVYLDEWNENNEREVPVEASADFQFARGLLDIAGEAKSGLRGSIAITVKDPDADTSRQRNTLPVEISPGPGSEKLTLYLEETGASTGVFKGILHFSSGEVRDKKGTAPAIILSQGDSIAVTYLDDTIPEGQSAVISGSYTWPYRKAEIKLDKSSYTGYNTAATITVNDIEANRNPEAIDRVTVTVSGTSMPEFSMYISETNADSGQFKGKAYFRKQEKSSGNNLGIKTGEVFTVVYNDQGDRSFGSVEAAASWTPQNAELKLDRGIYYGDNAEVDITVKDWDMAINADEADVVYVSVFISGKSALSRLPLRETGKNTGIFTNTLAVNASGSSHVKLLLKDGDELEVKYTDEDNTSGTSVERKASAIWKLEK